MDNLDERLAIWHGEDWHYAFWGCVNLSWSATAQWSIVQQSKEWR